MANSKSTRYHVIKTIVREIPAECTKSGKVEYTEINLFYKHGAWLADWILGCASELTKNQASKIVQTLNKTNSSDLITYCYQPITLV